MTFKFPLEISKSLKTDESFEWDLHTFIWFDDIITCKHFFLYEAIRLAKHKHHHKLKIKLNLKVRNLRNATDSYFSSDDLDWIEFEAGPKPGRGHGSLFFEGRVVEELLDEVDVAEKHPAAAVALQAERVQSVTEKKN